MDEIAQLLLERAQYAEALCRNRTSADLRRLRSLLTEADRDFEPSRAVSQHIYDRLKRIRYLEAAHEGGFAPCSGLLGEPPIELSAEDDEEFQGAVRGVVADQHNFSLLVIGRGRRDRG